MGDTSIYEERPLYKADGYSDTNNVFTQYTLLFVFGVQGKDGLFERYSRHIESADNTSDQLFGIAMFDIS